ncbi:hypothetical protein BURCENBC7_AP7991 [Burkholderia cenocepacia BC7]|nr:hypothetical protein BURCENBC7_AP7991 [Burkholderia cenocepacia BC7]
MKYRVTGKGSGRFCHAGGRRMHRRAVPPRMRGGRQRGRRRPPTTQPAPTVEQGNRTGRRTGPNRPPTRRAGFGDQKNPSASAW